MNQEYYECHITIDPVLDETRLPLLKELAKSNGFKVAELLMKKKNEFVYSDMDSFLTARDMNREFIHEKMFNMCDALKSNGYTIRRYKIEYAFLDSRCMGDIHKLM